MLPGAGPSEGVEVGHWAFPVFDPFPPCPSLAPAKWVEHYMGVATSGVQNSVAFKVGLFHRPRKTKTIPGHCILIPQPCVAKMWSASMPWTTGRRCPGYFLGVMLGTGMAWCNLSRGHNRGAPPAAGRGLWRI